jgi:putative beta-lysine N-acetyltransferase
MPDIIEEVGGSTIQHGEENDRIYLMKLDPVDAPEIVPELERLAADRGYGKIFAKVPAPQSPCFLQAGYRREARVPDFYAGREDAVFLSRFLDQERALETDRDRLDGNLQLAAARHGEALQEIGEPPLPIAPAGPEDAAEMAAVYREVFASYPFPIHDPAYLVRTMAENFHYFLAREDERVVAISSAETDPAARNVEMTDFATLPAARGKSLATHLLLRMEREMRRLRFLVAYTIARALSPGMNITFSRLGYDFGGRLVNNTNISGRIESMNVWYKRLVAASGDR